MSTGSFNPTHPRLRLGPAISTCEVTATHLQPSDMLAFRVFLLGRVILIQQLICHSNKKLLVILLSPYNLPQILNMATEQCKYIVLLSLTSK